MKKYQTKKHLPLTIAKEEGWSDSHKKTKRRYHNTSDEWRQDLFNLSDEKRTSEIFRYALEGNKKMIKALIKSAEEDYIKDVFDKDNNNALMYAIKGGNLETVKYLIELGYNMDYINKMGMSPLHLAIRKNRIDLVKVLLAADANLYIQNNNGETPLFEAVYEGNVEMLKFLNACGAKLNVRNKDGETPLIVASKAKHRQEVLLALLYMNVKIDDVDKDGRTAFIHAIINDNSGMMDILLKNKTDMNVVDKFGMNPVAYCAFTGNREALRVLIARGANFTNRNVKGKSPYEIARENNHSTCAEILAKAEKIMKANFPEMAKREMLKEFAHHNRVPNSCVK